MSLSAKTIRTQLSIWKPLLSNCSLDTLRKGQERIGELMGAGNRRQVLIKEHRFEAFSGAWVLPKDERRQGVILYLHGGGYVCGGLEYAKGFGSTLAVQTGTKVFCAAYRLAPEHPFPAPVEDALTAYRYLLEKGYTPEHICLCGESAGGGLCYGLCMKLREMGLPIPGSIIAISPWTDLTASGPSYEENRDKDPSMSREILNFFAEKYTDDRKNPLVSPLFGDLTDMPASLIFVGGDEIMVSDAQLLHEKLLEKGCISSLMIRPDRWHGYILYDLDEDREDYTRINHFLDKYLSPANKLRWMRLDNAAKIYPAARRQDWSSIFRLSATLREEVDVSVLQSALDVTVRRFPSIAARLRRGVFWYYLQQIQHAPKIQEEYKYPLTKMSRAQVRQCAFRVIVYKKRIAIEFFHSLTDGTGALVFLKSLVAEYLQQRYGLRIPAEKGVLGRLEEPSEEEMEDSFQKYAGPVAADRKGSKAWFMSGTPEADGFQHLTCFKLPIEEVKAKAKAYGISVTAFLNAVLMAALQDMQAAQIPNPRHRRPIKILVPVNLRQLFPSKTLRNFAMFVTPEITPRIGHYSFEEICKVIHHHMGQEITPKQMSKILAANVGNERLLVVKVMPLFIKNLVMKAIFNAVGEKQSCLNISNLGLVTLPEVMMPYVDRLDFILAVQATKPNNCAVVSFKDTVYINFIRNTREPELEYHFHRTLQGLGLTATVESNRGEE